MQQIKWKVSGMDCNTCALHIHKFLEKKGLQQVKVNFANGDVWFVAEDGFAEEPVKKGIADLGYQVIPSSRAPVLPPFHRPLFFRCRPIYNDCCSVFRSRWCC